MIGTGDAVRIALAAAIAMSGLGLSLAWLPALRYDGAAAAAARLLLTAGLVAAMLDLGGLGGVLGLALAGMGAAAVWQSQLAPQVPRPRRKGVLIAAAATGLAIMAALRGWSLLGQVPEAARPIAALAAGSVTALATLAVADRARVRMREAIRERRGQSN
ncbi:MAG: hypothetical protein ACRDWI_05115 [Jiangellaceae bacterium]